MIIRYTVREMWRGTDVIVIFHFGLFFPFYSPNNPRKSNPNKMKKTPRDIIILHRCTKNHCHMLYRSWDIVCDGCNCHFSFWAIFWPFTSLTAWKKKISKKMKKQKQKKQKKKNRKKHNSINNNNLEISSFYTSVSKIMIIFYTVPEIYVVWWV